MTHEFVPYELAVKLKALDYPQDDYFSWYNGNGKLQWDFEYDEEDFSKSCCSAPTFSQAFRWFREKYELFSSCDISNFADKTYGYVITSPIPPHYLHNVHNLKSMEEAEIACLTKLIEIVEEA